MFVMLSACHDSIRYYRTLRPVFSNMMNFPSGEHSGIATAPFAVRWYVVFADISPFVIVKLLPANISYVIRVEIQFVHTHSTPTIERNIMRSLLCACWQDNWKISVYGLRWKFPGRFNTVLTYGIRTNWLDFEYLYPREGTKRAGANFWLERRNFAQ